MLIEGKSDYYSSVNVKLYMGLCISL